MRRIIIAAAMGLCVVSLAVVSSADTLVMRDGTRIEGTAVSLASRTITFRHADGVSRRYSTNQVEAVEFISADRTNPARSERTRPRGARRDRVGGAHGGND